MVTSVTPGPTKVSRAISIQLRGSLVVKGHVRAAEAACVASVRVKIQRKYDGAWHTIAKDKTSSSGFYSQSLPDREGKYRAVAVKVQVDDLLSPRAVSRSAKH
ncbi:MAG: hypothetical protein WB297_06605 [Actinomycetota bacterium]